MSIGDTQGEYISFGQATFGNVILDTPMAVGEFFTICTERVACERFGQEFSMIRGMIACMFYPTYRIFEGRLLINDDQIPFTNTSELFTYLTQTLHLEPNEIALHEEQDINKVGFALSIQGLRKCATVFESIRVALLHAEMITKAYEEVKKNQ
jgi:hypothetical protein